MRRARRITRDFRKNSENTLRNTHGCTVTKKDTVFHSLLSLCLCLGYNNRRAIAVSRLSGFCVEGGDLCAERQVIVYLRNPASNETYTTKERREWDK